MDRDMHFHLPDGYEAGFDSLIKEGPPIKWVDTNTTTVSVFDTFDWLLYNHSLALMHHDFRLYLRRLPNGEQVESLVTAPPSAFIWDMQDNPLKNALEPVVDVRALLLVAEFHQLTRKYNVLNTDGKTIAGLDFCEVRFAQDEHAPVVYTYLRLIPLRGYQKPTKRIVAQIREVGFITINWGLNYSTLLKAIGVQPGDYSSKLDVQLEQEMRADRALKIILVRLLEIMRTNEDGIKADIDTEFLHDFRVAIRRTRSALSQLKFVLTQEDTDHFRMVFADLGQRSNDLRDLDVYLLAEHEYRQMLPRRMRDEVTPLFDYLRSQREKALMGVIEYLDSNEYAAMLADWDAFLNETNPAHPEPPKAAYKIIDLARMRIYKRYRRVLKDGRAILKDAPDEQLHALRIECKKLRYLMEFFISLFPPRQMAKLVGQLKILQDNLGEFNDLSVHGDYLLNIAEKIPINDGRSRRALIGIGYLVEKLEVDKVRVKAEFYDTFQQFSDRTNQTSFRKLFAREGIKT